MTTAFISGLLAFVAMEFVAAFAHRFLMHGPLCMLHKDHHQPVHGRFFQKNDLFFLIFALPSAFSIHFGLSRGLIPWVGIGFGIMAYGVAYLVVHELLVHRRGPIKLNTNNLYVRSILKAHQVHHQRSTKDGCKHFGLLYVRSSRSP